MKLIIATAFLFLSLLSASNSSEIHTTCHIPTAVKGGNTTLTCSFSVDVSLLKHDIQIVLQSNMNDEENTRILTCLWDAETLDCIVHASFNFSNKISNTLKLEIPVAEQIPAGYYSCIVMGVDKGNFEMCSFGKQDFSTSSRRVQITSSNSKISAVPSAASTQQIITLHSIPVMSPSVTNRLQKDETTEDTSNTKGEEKTVILVMGIMTGFAFIIAMSIAVIVVKLKRRIGSLEGESSRPQSLHVEKRETLHTLPVEVDNRPPERKTELVPVPKIAQITQLEALPDSSGSDSKVNFTCQGADVMQVVFILKGQPSNPEITQTTAPALPQSPNYLTPCPPGYSTLDSTTTTQNIDNQQVTIEQPPECDNAPQRHTQYYMLPSYMEENTENNGEDITPTAINSGKTKNSPISDVESSKTLDNKLSNVYERHSKVSIGAESYYTTID